MKRFPLALAALAAQAHPCAGVGASGDVDHDCALGPHLTAAAAGLAALGWDRPAAETEVCESKLGESVAVGDRLRIPALPSGPLSD